MRIALVLLMSLLTHTLHARSLWDEIDEVFSVSLCESFKDSQTYTFHRKNCSRFGCDEYQYLSKTFCDFESDIATLQYLKTNGALMSQETYKNPEWESKNGNLFRYYVDYVQSFGMRFDLLSVEDVDSHSLKITFRIFSNSLKEIESGYWIVSRTGSEVIPKIRKRYTKKSGIFAEENTYTYIPNP